MTNQEIQDKIKGLVENHEVILFMKGEPEMPQCGFSMRTASILMGLHVDFASVNVLEDMDIRQGIKEFTNWPTIPQLYIKGEFVGGCEIVEELFDSGELQTLLELD